MKRLLLLLVLICGIKAYSQIATPIYAIVWNGDTVLTTKILTVADFKYYDAGSVSGAVTINFNNGLFQKVTTSGNITSWTLQNVPEGFNVKLLISVGGAHTIATTGLGNAFDNSQTLLEGNGDINLIQFDYDGTTVRYSAITKDN